MRELLRVKIVYLSDMLKKRGNKTSLFFHDLLADIDNGFMENVVDKLIHSYAITQYANFTHEEECLFDEIWNIVKEYKDKNFNNKSNNE